MKTQRRGSCTAPAAAGTGPQLLGAGAGWRGSGRTKAATTSPQVWSWTATTTALAAAQFSTRPTRSAGTGAPPDTATRTEDRSRRSKSGWPNVAMIMVGVQTNVLLGCAQKRTKVGSFSCKLQVSSAISIVHSTFMQFLRCAGISRALR